VKIDKKNDLSFLLVRDVPNPSKNCPVLPIEEGAFPVKRGEPIVQMTSRNGFWFRSGHALNYVKRERGDESAEFDLDGSDLQTDITVEPGDSGGYNLSMPKGSVVSITRARDADHSSPGYGIPSSYLLKDLRELKQEMQEPGWLEKVTPSYSERLWRWLFG
jgi:hypothetical protein